MKINKCEKFLKELFFYILLLHRNNSLVRKIFPIIIGLLLVAGFYYLASTSGLDNNTFRELDLLITSEHNQLKLDYAQMKISQQQYFEKLEELSKKEDHLFNEVKLHKFENITEHNYWYRSRLKFPSNIKMEIFRITQAKKDSL